MFSWICQWWRPAGFGAELTKKSGHFWIFPKLIRIGMEKKWSDHGAIKSSSAKYAKSYLRPEIRVGVCA